MDQNQEQNNHNQLCAYEMIDYYGNLCAREVIDHVTFISVLRDGVIMKRSNTNANDIDVWARSVGFEFKTGDLVQCYTVFAHPVASVNNYRQRAQDGWIIVDQLEAGSRFIKAK